MEYTIRFNLSDGTQRTAPAQAGDVLLEVARNAGIDIDAPCGGSAICGKCRVQLLDGSLDAEQNRHLTADDWDAGWRLACASRICGDATIGVPDSAAAFRSGIRTADLSDPQLAARYEAARTMLREQIGEDGTNFEVISLTLTEPTLDDPAPDIQRLEDALRSEAGCSSVRLTLTALRELAAQLRRSNFSVDCVLLRENDAVTVYHIAARGAARLYGIAVDIGTTTVSAVLIDLESAQRLAQASAGNAQIRYGADVIHRIIASKRPGGSESLRRAVVEDTLAPLFRRLCREAGIQPAEVVRIAIAGNTTMNHLLLGVDSDPIRLEPYVPSFYSLTALRAGDIGLPGHPDAPCLILPNVGSYVGGDITAGLLVTPVWHTEECSLFVDLGTNGELVMGNSDFLLTCACSAGPAFEGGEISCGMRATDGAVDTVHIDADTMEPTLHVLGGCEPTGLCGSGLIDLVAELFRTRILDARGRFCREGARVAHDEHGLGRYIIRFATHDTPELSLTEVDVESLIRAKGAIFSAIRTMLASVGFTPEDIADVYIAGGIGGGINIDSTIAIGMLPDIDRARYHYLGNTSLHGACCALLSNAAAEQVEALRQRMTYLELSAEPDYMNEFVAACFLPHTDTGLFPSVV